MTDEIRTVNETEKKQCAANRKASLTDETYILTGTLFLDIIGGCMSDTTGQSNFHLP